jgi:hypothetical protein
LTASQAKDALLDARAKVNREYSRLRLAWYDYEQADGATATGAWRRYRAIEDQLHIACEHWRELAALYPDLHITLRGHPHWDARGAGFIY